MHQIQSKFHLKGFLETRIGGRPENQDACGFSDTPIGALTIVCDGMGGMNGGSTASHLAVKTIIELVSSVSDSDNPEETIRRAVKEANDTILSAAAADPELQGMGTTLTLVLVNADCSFITHVGDSRVYVLRSGKKAFRTFDDSVVFQLVKSGALTEEEARVAENSNIITKALGIASELEFEIVALPYDKGDRFILCTDGFWGALPETRLIELMGNRKEDLSIILERSFSKVETAAKELRPTHYDNLTAAVFDVEHNSTRRSKMEKRLKVLSGLLAILLLLCIGFAIKSYHASNCVGKAIKYQKQAALSQSSLDSLEALRVQNVEMLGGKKKAERVVAKAKKEADRDRKKAEKFFAASKKMIDDVDSLKNGMKAPANGPVIDTTRVNTVD